MELRKAHKVESFLKRRNITLSSLPDEEALSPDFTSNELVGPRKPRDRCAPKPRGFSTLCLSSR